MGCLWYIAYKLYTIDDVRDNEQVRSLHEGCEVFSLLLGDAIPDG